MTELTRNSGCHYTLGTDAKPSGPWFMPAARLRGPAPDQRPTKYRSRCPCPRLPIPAPKTNGLALFHCRGLEQRSPIYVYREQKLPASSFQGDPQIGPTVRIGGHEASHVPSAQLA